MVGYIAVTWARLCWLDAKQKELKSSYYSTRNMLCKKLHMAVFYLP